MRRLKFQKRYVVLSPDGDIEVKSIFSGADFGPEVVPRAKQAFAPLLLLWSIYSLTPDICQDVKLIPASSSS